MSKISIHTSVDDLLMSFRFSIERYTPEDFEAAIKEEESGANRKTVIKLLKRGLRNKKLGAKKL